ncbi:MAG: hypothetical protein WC617_17710 [Rhodanobacter sp.]|jgi:hypothetical protein
MIDRLSNVRALDMEHAEVFDMQPSHIAEGMGKQLNLPVHVIHRARPAPVIFLSAVHG